MIADGIATGRVKRPWHERDNFTSQERAEEYMHFKHSQHPVTPYRIAHRAGRWAVDYIPEWEMPA
jgi:hypothetical protein